MRYYGLSQVPNKALQVEMIAQPMLDIWRILALEKRSRVEGQHYVFSLTEEDSPEAEGTSAFRFEVHRKTTAGAAQEPVLVLRSPELFPKEQAVHYHVADVNLSAEEVGKESPFLSNASHLRELLRGKMNVKAARSKQVSRAVKKASLLGGL